MSIYTAEDGGQEQGDVKKAKGAFRTISEVADRLGVQQHVLRFWETKFSQVKPLTRGGGRRYYRPEDVAVLEKIYNILYKEGYTIKGAQKLLKGMSKGQIAKLSLQRPAMEQVNSPTVVPSVLSDVSSNVSGGLNTHQKAVLESMLGDLKEIRDILKK
ncbi:MAG: MerR family transcriptional regulator [Alphaproteobacteria bacterium]|nr:MerR family transcriptional regulator [Alphaproteobacteria bacterium]